MMKFRLALVFGLLVAVCLINTTTAEEGAAEPESEPESEPEAGDDDSKHAGSSVNEKTKAAQKNPATIPMAFSIPAITTLAVIAKVIL